MIDTLSVRETAQIYGSSRQNILNFISRGVIKAERGKELKTMWRITPEVLANFTRNQMPGLIPAIGLFLLSDGFHKNGAMSDEIFDEIKYECREMINIALTVDALISAVNDMITNIPALTDLMSEDE